MLSCSFHDYPPVTDHSKRVIAVPETMNGYEGSYCCDRDTENPIFPMDALSTVSKRMTISFNPPNEFLFKTFPDEHKDSLMKGLDESEAKREIKTKPSFGKKGRTKSFDRRLSEAAQYAEAVGDPSANYAGLIVVDDIDEDDEDENDANLLMEQTNHDRSRHQIISLTSPKSITHSGERRPWIRSNEHSFFQHHLTGFHTDTPSFIETSCAKINDNECKGILFDPPEITTHGVSRGNFAQLHRKAWLEVSDKYHRYGKNLRVYYKHWEELGHPTNVFFDWLDSKGEAAGLSLPNLSQCPRSELDSDTVLYITNPDIQRQYKLSVTPTEDKDDSQYTLVKAKIQTCDSSPVYTGPEGWIFVLRDHELYAAKKVTSVLGKSKQRFHHSSFFGGKAVQAAGILITDEHGFLKYLYPHSGHYRPGEGHMQSLLYHFFKSGVDINSFQVDMQQIMHVSREKCDETTPKGGDIADECNDTAGIEIRTKLRKTDSLYLESGFYVAAFLGHKSLMMSLGLFDQIQRIQLIPYGSSVRDIVTSAFIENGMV